MSCRVFTSRDILASLALRTAWTLAAKSFIQLGCFVCAQHPERKQDKYCCVFGFNNFAQCYDLDPLNTSYTLSCQIRRSELCVAYKSASPFTPIHTYIHFDLSHPHIKSVSTKYALSGTLPWIRTPAKNVLVPMWCKIMFYMSKILMTNLLQYSLA